MRAATATGTRAVLLLAALVGAQPRAGAAALEVEIPRRCWYGGRRLTVKVRGVTAGARLLWRASVHGAVAAKGRERARVDGVAIVSFKLPEVKRRATMALAVQEAKESGRRSDTEIEILPPYEWSRLSVALRGRSVGVAERSPNLLPALEKAGAKPFNVSRRLGLQAFPGGVLIVDGPWLSEMERELADLLGARLRSGSSLLVVAPMGSSALLEGVVSSETPALPVRVATWDPECALSSAAGLLAGHPGAERKLSGRGNFRPLVGTVAGADGATAPECLAAEYWPARGGHILALACELDLASGDDPAGPPVLEQCLRHLTSAPPSKWRRTVCTVGAESPEGKLLKGLGVRGKMSSLGVPPRGDVTALVAAPGGGTEGDETPSLDGPIVEWIRSGGTAIVLYRGAPDASSGKVERCQATRGISAGSAAILHGERSGEVPDWCPPFEDEKAERVALMPGLLEKIVLGRGKCFMTRTGPVGEGRPSEWDQFLSVVLTNLGVRLVLGEEGR